MTLLITAFAAVIVTIVWYSHEKARKLKIGTLALAYWGASLMWFVDAAAEYLKDGGQYFTPAFSDMVNDTFLGLSVVLLGLIVWTAAMLIKDPQNIVKNLLTKKNI